MTTSEERKGSAKDYPHIHKIMTRVHKLLEESHSKHEVKVVYFLVCPNDASEHQWQMPAGWDQYITENDHRGECFCMRVPVPGHYGTSCPFTPNFSIQLNRGWI